MTWTHKFVCLADSAQEDVPVAADKHKFKCACLGEKIVLRLDGKYVDIKEALLHAYQASIVCSMGLLFAATEIHLPSLKQVMLNSPCQLQS